MVGSVGVSVCWPPPPGVWASPPAALTLSYLEFGKLQALHEQIGSCEYKVGNAYLRWFWLLSSPPSSEAAMETSESAPDLSVERSHHMALRTGCQRNDAVCDYDATHPPSLLSLMYLDLTLVTPGVS